MDRDPVSRHAATILNSLADGVFTIDLNYHITSFNQAAEKLTGITTPEAMGRLCHEIFRTNICETDCPMRKTLADGTSAMEKILHVIDNQGKRIPCSVATAALRKRDGTIIGGVETMRDLTLVEDLKRKVEDHYRVENFISRSLSLRHVFRNIPAIAESNAVVLIQGESGTGKELLARAIHQLSPRSGKPMVTVNCGALPDTLLESELFGYRKGAFTDARADKPGRFALADGGTIFLDEIGDMSMAMQVKLLRVLQDHVYEPLGSNNPVKVDVRIIAATNQDLNELVQQNKFRLDLYYRINVMRLDIPPLRKRREDIPILIDHFMRHYNKIYGKSITSISPAALAVLMRHEFPGNCRELENIIEHSFVLCTSTMIDMDHLPVDLVPQQQQPDDGSICPTGIHSTLENVEREMLLEALQRNRWNRQKTADDLGIHKATLFRKIHKLGIVLPDVDGRNRM